MSHEPPILYLVDASVAVTGAFIAARNTARALHDAARIVLVLPRGHRIAAEELQDFWRVESIPMVSLSKSLPALLRYFPALVLGAWRLKQSMARDGATRLQLNDFYLMHGALLRLFGFRGSIVSWVRCDPSRFAGPLARPMLALMGKSANRVVAVSAYVQSLLPPTMQAEILYDYYAGPTRDAKTWQAADEKILVYVGNYIRGKGQDMALAAFAKAAAQDATLRLHFYGGDMGLPKNRDYRAQLQEAAQRSGFGSRIAFFDFAAEPFAALETAFAALNFSASESFSMTVLEASGAGLPVIATASGGPQEIIVEEITGYLIPVGDSDAAAACIFTLAGHPPKAAAMGQAAANHVQQHFSQAAFSQSLRRIWGH